MSSCAVRILKYPQKILLLCFWIIYLLDWLYRLLRPFDPNTLWKDPCLKLEPRRRTGLLVGRVGIEIGVTLSKCVLRPFNSINTWLVLYSDLPGRDCAGFAVSYPLVRWAVLYFRLPLQLPAPDNLSLPLSGGKRPSRHPLQKGKLQLHNIWWNSYWKF